MEQVWRVTGSSPIRCSFAWVTFHHRIGTGYLGSTRVTSKYLLRQKKEVGSLNEDFWILIGQLGRVTWVPQNRITSKCGLCNETSSSLPKQSFRAGAQSLGSPRCVCQLDVQLPCWAPNPPLSLYLPCSRHSAFLVPEKLALGFGNHAALHRILIALLPPGHGTVWHLQILGDHWRRADMGVVRLPAQGCAYEGLRDGEGRPVWNHLRESPGEILHSCK